MTRSDLLDLVYRFYPRGIRECGLGYDDTEEYFRQTVAARQGAAEYPTWKAMLRRLDERYSVVDHSFSLQGGACLVAYSGWVLLPGPTPGSGHRLGFHVSLLGPYYGIHRKGAPGEEPVVPDLVREIEATYPGYETIPQELGNEVVPDVMSFGKTTIYDCIFSDDWKTSSGPYQERSRDDDVDPPDDPDEPYEPFVKVHDVRGGRSLIYTEPLADWAEHFADSVAGDRPDRP